LGLKEEFLSLLERDREFRYAVIGLLGLEDLRSSVKTLADAIAELIEVQRKSEERLGRLEESHIKLIDRFEGLSREMGRLSETIGFSLEDIARAVVPGWLYRHEGIIVKDLVRKFFYIEGTEIEVNLYGEGIRNGKRIIILGEVKSRIYRSDVEKFYESVERIAKAVREPIYPLMFAFYIHPSAEEEARVRGIRLIASYMR